MSETLHPSYRGGRGSKNQNVNICGNVGESSVFIGRNPKGGAMSFDESLISFEFIEGTNDHRRT